MSIAANVNDSLLDRLESYVADNPGKNAAHIVDLLPIMLQLKGKPYTLTDYAPFEELFRLFIPKRTTYCSGRQVAKSTSQAACGIVRCAIFPNDTYKRPYSILYLTPLFEQVRRFSSMVVSPFIEDSPIRPLLVSTRTTKSVLYRQLRNGSSMLFSYCSNNADRVRGISVDQINLDEIQDIETEHLPVVFEVITHSKNWAIVVETGTPKTQDNTLQVSLDDSSWAEWFVPCFHCTTNGKPTQNIPSKDFHLDKMIGPWHENISEKHPATICYKCGKPISPRFGRWVHRYPERRWTHAGYHIPQIIMPIHYADPDKWATLLTKRRTLPAYLFYNEVLGESYDRAAKLVTLTQLDKVSILHENTVENALRARRSNNYILVTLGVDWGGGGMDEISYTAIALCGLLADGRIDVLWGARLLTPNDHLREAKELREICKTFSPDVLVHDYTGAGAVRETVLVQSGFPENRIMPCSLVRSARQAPCYYVAPTELHPRGHYRIDKTRTLLTTCGMINTGRIRFFKRDYISEQEPGLIRDFLALVEEKTISHGVSELYRIIRAKGKSDDFAHAVNFGCVGLWHIKRAWPNMADHVDGYISEEDEKNISGGWV